MNFNEYQSEAMMTAVNVQSDITALAYRTLGLTGEAGEVAEKVKKIIRDKNGKVDDQDKKEIIKELGDVLWYLQAISAWLGVDFDDVAKANLEKVKSRKNRGVTHGSGDNR